MNLRISEHPIIDINKNRKKVEFYFESKKMSAFEDEVISSALYANGIKIFSYHKKDGSPQGIFCANGQCAQCSVVADGVVVKACITKIKEGMDIRTLKGVAKLKEYDSSKMEFSSIQEIDTDVLIVGGGPSGMSACEEIAKFNLDVILIDDKSKFGGKLVLQTHKFFGSVDDCYAGTRGIDIAEKLYSSILKYPSVKLLNEATCFGVFADKKVGVIRNGVCYLIKPKAVIFATGAREKMLLFDGNTLPGVYGAGAFQTLLNRDLIKPSERLFVIGGGNVGLITAYHAIQAGIKVVGLCEIADRCGGYKVHEDKIKRLGVKIFTRHTVLRVEGKESVERIIISEVDDKFVPIKGSEKVFEVDTVLVAAGLSPINELYNEAIKFGMLAFVCGDAEEIAEASAAMFSGKICAHKVLKELGFITKDVPKFWFEKLNILKSRPGKIVQNSNPKTNLNVYPVIHCRQEIPCNPCSTVCPKKSIKINPANIMEVPVFDGECIGCFKCLLICPGLAITIVDKRKDPLNPIVWVPFEINTSFKKGDRVLAVGEEGEFLGDFEVVDIKNFTAEKTRVIGIKATNEVCDKISSIKILDEENFLKYSSNISNMNDDVVVCRCERVSLGEIRKWIRKGVRDLNQLKALTRLGMGACGSKTCGQLIYSVLRSEGVDFKEVRNLTKRPLFVEVEFQSFCVSGDDDKKKADNFSNF
jgi:sarcosine oxidase subunit alpha